MDLGFVERALPHFIRAQDQDPLVAINNGYLGLAYATQGRWQEAGPLTQRAVELSALPFWSYFTAIGLAFLFVEIAFLQKVMLLVHHPTIALALVLGTFLLAAGAGSAWSSRVPEADGRRALVGAVLGIVLLGVCYGVAFDALIVALGTWPAAARALIAALLLAPLAFCMGIPFPLALRGLEQPLVPWAWGINGCASVVSAALATMLAVNFGFRVVLALALALYVGILAVLPRRASLAGQPGLDRQVP